MCKTPRPGPTDYPEGQVGSRCPHKALRTETTPAYLSLIHG